MQLLSENIGDQRNHATVFFFIWHQEVSCNKNKLEGCAMKSEESEQIFAQQLVSFASDLRTRKAEALNSLTLKITANETDTNDILQTFR